MNEASSPYRVNFFRALKKGFREAYDHMGYVVMATLAAFVFTASYIALVSLVLRQLHSGFAGFLLFIPAALIVFVWSVGVFYYAYKSVFCEHPNIVDTLAGIKILLVPALKLFVVDFMISGLLIGDFVFFASAAKNGMIFLALAIMFAYLTIAWLMTAMYHLPLLAAQLNMESGTGPFVVLRKSLLMTVDNLGFTVGFFIAIIAFAVLCIIPGLIGMALLFLGGIAFILNHALHELFIKYDIVEYEPDDVKEESWKLPESWRKRRKDAE